MRRFLKIACLVLLVLASVSLRASAAFSPVIGTLEEIEQTKDGWRIFLLVEGQRASGLLSPECAYEIDGNEVTQEAFFEGALHQRVTVELDEKSGDVVRCRLEILRLN